MELEDLLRQLNLFTIAAIDEYGNTGLHLTVKNKTFTQKKIVEVLEILLDMGIDPNTKNKNNETVLQLAIAYRMKDVVNFLMSRKINMDSIPHFFIENDYLMIQEMLPQMNNLNVWNTILGMQTVSADFAEWLISKGFDFDCKNQENRSALSMAIEHNLQHILPVLLKYTKDINFIDIAATDKDGNTALHSTIKNKSFTQEKIVEVTEVLIGRGINPNSKNNKKQTALHLAVLYRMKDVINCLMAHKVDLDLVAHFFVEHEYLTFQEWFAQMDNLDEWYGEILRMETESIDFVEWLILKGFDFDCKNQENRSALSLAIEHNLQHILPVLLKYTKDINFIDIAAIDKDGNTALHLTIQNKSYTQEKIVEVIEVLIGKGSNPNSKNNKNQTALHLAVLYKMKDVISCLMAHKVNLDLVAHFFVEHEYLTFQELFAQMDHLDELYGEVLRMETESIDFVEWLISKGIDFDCKNQENGSALNMAIEHNLQHILIVLLKYTRDINFVNMENKTLLHLFLQNNFQSTYCNTKSINKNWYAERYAAEIVRIILKRGVSADAEDMHKLTPIQLAIAKKEDISVIQTLIERCSNIHQRDIHNETMFQVVIRYCLSASESRMEYYLKILSSLIAKGADVNDVYELDKYGYTVLCYAVADQNMWLVNFLEENRADFSVTTKNGRSLLHLLATSTARDDAEMEACNITDNKYWDHEYVFYDDTAVAQAQNMTVIQKHIIQRGVPVGRIGLLGNTAILHVASIIKGDISLMELFLEKNKANFSTVETWCMLDVSKLDEEYEPDGMVPRLADYTREYVSFLELSEENGEDFRAAAKSSYEKLLHPHTNTDNIASMKLFDLLIRKGCEVNAKDIRGNTPLHEAVSHNNVAIIRKLIKHGADVNSRNNRKETPLHFVTKTRNAAELGKILLGHGANVHAKDSGGQTPLHREVIEYRQGNYNMLCTLLKYGADVNALDARGLSAFSYVFFREHKVLLEMEGRSYVHMFKNEDVLANYNSDFFFCLEFSEQEGWHFARKSVYLECEDTDCVAYPGHDRDLGDVRLYFARHSMKLKAANLPWDPKIDSAFEDYRVISLEFVENLNENYYEECLVEVEILKRIFIDENRTSLYTLLHMNLNRRRAFVHYKELRELVHSPVLKKQFPKYFILILACYQDAVTRKSLFEQAREAWLELTKIYLPVEILEFIFSFLSNADLYHLIEKN